MASMGNPPGGDPRGVAVPLLRTGPILEWYPVRGGGQPGGLTSCCKPCEDKEEQGCPGTPDPAEGIQTATCSTQPGDGRAPGGGGSAGTGPGGSGPWLASRAAGLQRIPAGIGVSLPRVSTEDSCQGGGSCGGFVGLDGNLQLQVIAGATGEATGFCAPLVSNSAQTPGLSNWRDGSSPTVEDFGADANLLTPSGTSIVYTNKPVSPGSFYTTPQGVRSRLKLVAGGYEEHCFNGVVRSYSSDVGLKKLIKWTGRAGTWTVTRDTDPSTGAPRKVIQDPAGRRTTYQYDDFFFKLSSITDSGGRETQFVFDELDGKNLLQVTGPELCVTEFTYDGARISSWTTPSGIRTTFTYEPDTSGRVRTIQTPDGTRTLTYSGANSDLAVMDAKGALTTYVRDASGQLQALVDPLGQRTTYTWDSKWPTAIQDPRGYVFTYQYQSLAADANLRQLQAVVLPEGGRFTYQLDGSDNLVAVIDERGYRTSMTYASARLATIQDPLGRVTTYSYSTQFNQPSEIQDALGQRWTAVYDSRARKTEGINPKGERTTLTYDVAGFVETVKNPLSQVTTFTRDGLNRLTRVTNPLGEVTSYSYASGSCRLQDQTDPRGLKTTYQYDVRGHLAATINALGQRTSFTYDVNGNQTVVENALGQRSTSSYDKLNRLESVTNALGYKTSYTYDKSGSVETVKDALNQVTTNVYDKNRRLSAVANPVGQRSTFGYDVAGNRTSVQDALGFVATTTYGALGGVSEQIDALGQRTSFTYDAVGRQRSLQDATGALSTTSYDTVGRAVSTQDARGSVTTQSYDAAGRLRTVQDAEGFTSTYSYDAAGRVRSQQDPLGRVTTYGYDVAGNQVSVQNALGSVTTSVFDRLGRVEATQNPLGARSTLTFDAAGRQITAQNALGYVTTSTYDAAGQLRCSEDALGKRTTQTYDAVGRRSATQDAEGQVTTSTYDGASRLREVQDARGNRRTLTYDAVGQVTREQDALGRVVTSTYDRAGRLATRQDARGITTTFSYDGVGRVTSRFYQNDGRVTTTYDGVGNPLTIAEPLGRWTMVYDKVNRARSVQDPASKTITYALDAGGQRTVMTAPTGGLFSYSYYADGQTRWVQNPEGDRTTFSYDVAGRLTKKELANATLASFAYDAADRTTVVANLRAAGTVISRYTYTYDAVGNRTRLEEGGTSVVTWSYDNAHRLRGEWRGGTGAFRTTYTLDGVGNRTVQQKDGALTTSVYDSANQLSTSRDATGTTTYSFDRAGNLQVVQSPASARTSYTWDNENRNTRLQLADNSLVTMSYRFDGLRVRKDSGAVVTKFIYDGQNELAETDAANTINRVLTQEPAGYGNLVSQRVKSGVIWTPYYHHFDALGSTRQVTSAVAALVNSYGYTAWGEAIAALTSESVANAFRWVGMLGYFFDDEADTYYVRARHYDPVTGRWLSQDPIAHEGSRRNLYEYVAGNPIRFLDPDGMQVYFFPPGWPWSQPPKSQPCCDILTLCMDHAEAAQKVIFGRAGDPYGGGYRHCVAGCCLVQLFGPSAAYIGVFLWDMCIEPKDTFDSHMDMQAENNGLWAGLKWGSCHENCLQYYPYPEVPLPRPVPLPPVEPRPFPTVIFKM